VKRQRASLRERKKLPKPTLLCEIGDMPHNVQASLLRVLQEREVVRIGDNRLRKIDVRVIAATNKDLTELIDEGDFRLDLY